MRSTYETVTVTEIGEAGDVVVARLRNDEGSEMLKIILKNNGVDTDDMTIKVHGNSILALRDFLNKEYPSG